MTHLEVIQRVWPEWVITGKIGEGSFGQVFRAEKESFGIKQEAAIKVVRIPSDETELRKVKSSFGLNDEELRDYFYPQVEKLTKEITLMRELDNSNNIVKIHDFEIKESLDLQIGWHILIRMDFLECLEDYVKRADITVGDVVTIGEDILTSLEACEENNIIHRDIKPANLFRSAKGVYKLGDFGIARDMKASSGSLSYKGTENYMAPEIYMGKKYGSTIDIYALGIVLYKLLNKNRLPFMSEEKLTSESIERAFQKRNTGEPLPKPMQASDAMYEVIKKMCAYNPDDRFQMAYKAKEALSKYKGQAGEELNTVLDINNKIKDLSNTKNQDEEPVVNIFEDDIVSIPVIASQAKSQGMQSTDKAYANTQNTEDYTPADKLNTNISNAEKQVQSRVFDEPYNEEDTRDKTKSLYQEEDKIKPVESKQPSIKQILDEENGEDAGTNKKTKLGFIIGAGVAAFAFLAVLFIFVFVGGNSSKVAKAKEIYDDDSIFVIDEEEYKGQYIEHTTKFYIEDEFIERTGIYIGATKSGVPDGYGAFYYRREGNDENAKYTNDFILVGEWKEGNLIGGKDKVKKRILYNVKFTDGDKNKAFYIMEGDWGIGEFVGNPEGIFESSTRIKENGEITEKRFEGTFETDNYDFYNGDFYLNNNLFYRGEFKDGEVYNGKVYDENGEESAEVVDGEIIQQ